MERIKIPTLLGLTIILVGIISGVFLVVQNQTSFFTKASVTQAPKNITVSNIEDTSATVSWQTTSAVPGFISYSAGGSEETDLDDRDTNAPIARVTHHVTLKKLTPATTYQYQIFSGKNITSDLKLTTALSRNSTNGFNPVIGSVVNNDQPLSDGIIFLNLSGATLQSTVIKQGNFIIPLSKMYKGDLSDILSLSEGAIAKLTVVSDIGQASALFKLEHLEKPIGTLKIGQDLDLTIQVTPTINPDLQTFDMDGNLTINAADYSLVLTNFGRSPKNPKADINKDGVVDKKDLDLIAQKMTELGQAIPSLTPSPKK